MASIDFDWMLLSMNFVFFIYGGTFVKDLSNSICL